MLIVRKSLLCMLVVTGSSFAFEFAETQEALVEAGVVRSVGTLEEAAHAVQKAVTKGQEALNIFADRTFGAAKENPTEMVHVAGSAGTELGEAGKTVTKKVLESAAFSKAPAQGKSLTATCAQYITAVNIAKAVAVVLATYGVYKAVTYAYTHYRKKNDTAHR